ncbi:2Fe-2S iron-sulfur cluster-binding protein [Streptomyces sp. 3213.3]|uniref:2Fe-2S iron-sulfur cluster-binding protein n=1 Tax=Streptomyces sp. 3213.3 TaxID=1855348 RepID=UPI000B81FF49
MDHNPGRPDGTRSTGILTDPASTEVHLCGPAPFVTDMRAAVQAAGVPANSIRYDVFYSPRTVDITPRPAPHTGPFQVTYKSSGVTAKWSPEAGTFLELAESQGLTLSASCRAGVCGTCAATVHGRRPTSSTRADTGGLSVLEACSIRRRASSSVPGSLGHVSGDTVESSRRTGAVGAKTPDKKVASRQVVYRIKAPESAGDRGVGAVRGRARC